jgi:hypothetical protein
VIPFAPQGAKKAKRQKPKTKTIAPSRRRSPGSNESDWLKTLLPPARGGWWDPAEDGKGFSIHFRWRAEGKQRNLPFPRISAEQFQKLKEATIEKAKFLLEDRIYGHLEELCAPGSARRDRANAVAARLGFVVGNYLNARAANSSGPAA